MIRIYTKNGDTYEFDPSNEFIYRNGVIVPRSDFEPVFMNHSDSNTPPSLSGILITRENKVISLSGNINLIVDPNTIDL